MRCLSSKKRGSLLYGLAGIIVMTGALVGIILDRSLDSYRQSVDLEVRLRIEAAIQGFARTFTPNEQAPAGTIELRRSRIDHEEPIQRGDELVIPFKVIITNESGRVVHERSEAAVYTRSGIHGWSLKGFAP